MELDYHPGRGTLRYTIASHDTTSKQAASIGVLHALATTCDHALGLGTGETMGDSCTGCVGRFGHVSLLCPPIQLVVTPLHLFSNICFRDGRSAEWFNWMFSLSVLSFLCHTPNLATWKTQTDFDLRIFASISRYLYIKYLCLQLLGSPFIFTL